MSDLPSAELKDIASSKDHDARDNRIFVTRRFAEAVGELGLEGIAQFDGFYNSEFNDRSRASTYGVSFNERLIDSIPEEEADRNLYHELQHVKNHAVEANHPDFQTMRKFILAPDFLDLFKRMKAFYEVHKSRDYSFSKVIGGEPELGGFGFTYTEPNELLALLRGYERFLEQKEQNPQVRSEPYEFIGAFKPEDLKFLDFDYRVNLGRSVQAPTG